MPRRDANLRLGPTQIVVVIALILAVLDLLNIALGGLPLLTIAVILLCVAWLIP
jgi:hypothetical protein